MTRLSMFVPEPLDITGSSTPLANKRTDPHIPWRPMGQSMTDVFHDERVIIDSAYLPREYAGSNRRNIHYKAKIILEPIRHQKDGYGVHYRVRKDADDQLHKLLEFNSAIETSNMTDEWGVTKLDTIRLSDQDVMWLKFFME